MKPTSPRLLALMAAASLGLGLLLPRLIPGLPDAVTGVLLGAAFGLGLAALMYWRLPSPCDTAPAALRRRYTREIAVSMSAYAVAVIVSLLLLKRADLAMYSAKSQGKGTWRRYGAGMETAANR